MTKKKNMTFADGKALVTRLESSGLSRVSFAEKIGVSISLLRYWVMQIRKARKKK